MASTGVINVLGVPIPLGALSLITLTLQNSALTIVLHYSRISVPADKMYSAASAVLLNECLKGTISISIAFYNTLLATPGSGYAPLSPEDRSDEEKAAQRPKRWDEVLTVSRVRKAGAKLRKDVFSSDCWKLSIPACLYVVQNNLQFVAASNLDVPTFQVTYNLKILTTALFSVVLLRKRLTPKKWLALFFLAAGVGVVQLQSSTASGGHKEVAGAHQMERVKGLLAVASACMTSGLAGVYFEMVLKGSKADLWIRNVQLSFFSLLPAAVAVFLPDLSLFSSAAASAPPVERQPIFAHFGVWAWAVVMIQVLGGLVTALVIKFSDNIMKGFATSLAIVLSFCAGIILFDFQVTLSFLVGTCIVVGATYLYNQPDAAERRARSNSYSLATVSPSASGSPRHFIPAVHNSPGSRIYPNHSHSSSQGGAAAHSALRNQSFSATASPPAYRRPSGAPSTLAGSQTPDHVLGFPQGLGILDGAAPSSRATTPNGTVIEGGIAIPMLTEKLSAQHGVGVSTGPGGVPLQVETSPWVPYGPGVPSLAQRRGLNEGDYESPLTP
ncbi:nucleotide-sugar transporter-domain-containing protein [Leucosporidium creatinivorum]|uniref:Nucleotide-sugar transporter-domain-containing protein n=1 Tax=Leucosporidium creatinivorum TaxID=106004 RepID=A0A1Y2F8L5_9BASI|nr:nucleotide-sugar transporter-domain-containing protein [Leucosporidium creatinivorum]